jgi:SAM-dependent methyltransferase
MNAEDLLGDIALYYEDRLRQFGATAAGVDWKDEASQTLRFDQLLKLVADPAASVIDFGCGAGALLGHMRRMGFSGAYRGLDISTDMIGAASSRYADETQAVFEVGAVPSAEADYAAASGIFNVRLDIGDDLWRSHVLATLARMDRAGRRGFAFNCLTSYGDADLMKDYLFYADPCFYFDLCKRMYSRHVALLHDYGLYEFTIIVRKG